MGCTSFSHADLAVDLGTANTLIYVRGMGIVSNEPSVVAVQQDSRGTRDAKARAAREVYLIEQPIAAAIGTGLPITEPRNMIVDIGGGTSDVAVISLAGIVCAKSVRVGGDKMDEAIVQHIKRRYNLLIARAHGRVDQDDHRKRLPERRSADNGHQGRDLVAGVLRTLTVSSDEVRDALAEPVNALVEAVKGTLERSPPSSPGDIADRGIVLAGGDALLKGFDALLREETGLRCS